MFPEGRHPGGPQPHSGRSSRGQGTRARDLTFHSARAVAPSWSCAAPGGLAAAVPGAPLVSGGVVPVPGAW
jgi:hypothetical protein